MTCEAILLAWMALLCACGSDPAAPGEVRTIADAGAVDDSPVGALPPDSGSPRPAYGPTTTQAVAPPPISGGSLLISADGRTAVAADPDRDQVYVVDLLSASAAVSTIALSPGDEPGRLVEDAAGRVHVALRRGGAIATIDRAARQLLARRPACSAPRGIAYDPASDDLFVACGGGELVTMQAAPSGGVTRTVHLDRDLRDPVLVDGQLFVSRFRSSELLRVDPVSGDVSSRRTPGHFFPSTAPVSMTPDVAWRTISFGSTALAMVHQRAQDTLATGARGGNGTSVVCDTSVVESTLTLFDATEAADAGSPPPGPVLADAVLPVDVAASGSTFAVIAAGNGKVPGLAQLFVFDAADFLQTSADCYSAPSSAPVDGQAVAVAFDGAGRIIVFSREPASLSVFDPRTLEQTSSLPLAPLSREDTGHSIFHTNSGSFIACASCHAEGGDDGRNWTLLPMVSHRTQALDGTLAATAPYHWNGELKDIPALFDGTYVEFMNGDMLPPDAVQALQSWLFALPESPPSPPSDSASVSRGQQLFNDPSVGCSGCHSGPKFTNNATLDVGTGQAYQVPSLVGVAWRSPYMHAGCAASLYDRFEPSCGGGDSHGHTSQLLPSQVTDLVAYLTSL